MRCQATFVAPFPSSPSAPAASSLPTSTLAVLENHQHIDHILGCFAVIMMAPHLFSCNICVADYICLTRMQGLSEMNMFARHEEFRLIYWPSVSPSLHTF